MKTTIQKTSMWTMMLLIAFALQSLGATKANPDKVTEKARAMIEKAAPHDWESYAKAAQMCIKKEVNLTEAKKWIDTSLEVKDSALGHEVAGDYFMLNKLYKESIDHYVKSMLKLKEQDFYADTSDLQQKIDTAKKKL